jgi:hypothetical protein
VVPALRAADESLNPVVDKLEADHENVAALLDEVDAAAGQLADADSLQHRDRLVITLDQLATDLLAHRLRGGAHRRNPAIVVPVALHGLRRACNLSST